VPDVRHSPVDLADERGAIEGEADERVDRTGRVDVAHPVVTIRVDAETRERVNELAGEMSRVARMAVASRIRDVRQRAAHLAIDCVRGQQRLGIHGIHVVDAVEQRRLDSIGPEGAGDHVEDHRSAQAADVHRPGRRLRIVDDLGSDSLPRELVSPIHGARVAAS